MLGVRDDGGCEGTCSSVISKVFQLILIFIRISTCSIGNYLSSENFNLSCWLFCRRRRNFLYVALSRSHSQVRLVHSNFDEVTLATFRSDLWIVAKTILAAKFSSDVGKSRRQLCSIVGFVE